MSTPLLATKLFIPPARLEWVLRTNLIERLNQGLSHKLTLISAPAGFGKTTLLSELVYNLKTPERSGIPTFCWVSLDKEDNDPARFWAYVMAALQTGLPGVGRGLQEALQSPLPPPIETILATLINEIAAGQQALVLILDDFHVIEAQPIHDGLVFLLDHLPPQMHLVISSRANPPWPLACLRSRHDLVELRARDLRFTPNEAATFLNQIMKLNLTAGDTTALDERTEGWIAGLQMAALSLQGRDNAHSFISAFTGSHRFIFDYLVEEVLQNQTREVQDFLLETSILERLNASLCNYISGRESGIKSRESDTTLLARFSTLDSQTILENLDRANLFIIPLDNERQWYRYHHLFADLLRSRLEHDQPDQFVNLHVRASTWCEEHGFLPEAIKHALSARNIERAANLVEGNALALLNHGQLATLLNWLNALSQETVHSRPWLCIARAWLYAYGGQAEALVACLQDAENRLAEIEDLEQQKSLSGYIAAIRAYDTWQRGESELAIRHARQALEALPKTDRVARSQVATTLGLALQYSGDYDGTAQAYQLAVATSRETGDMHLTAFAYGCLAFLHITLGQPHQAYSTCQEGLSLVEEMDQKDGIGEGAGQGSWKLPTLGYIYTSLSIILLNWNDLEAALQYAKESVKLAERWEQVDLLHHSYTCLANVLIETGDVDGAFEIVQKAKLLASRVSPWFSRISELQEVRLNIAKGNLEPALLWMQAHQYNLDLESDNPNLFLGNMVASIYAEQRKYPEALQLLDKIESQIDKPGAVQGAITALILRTLILQELGKSQAALSALERALRLAEPEGFVRVFIRKGAQMTGLLRKAAARGLQPTFVSKLLSALEVDTRALKLPAQPEQPSLVSSRLVEPLSEREMEVLHLLVSSLSIPEIAGRLIVSPNTVRSHVKSIYGKLDVHNRMEAIERARELRLF